MANLDLVAIAFGKDGVHGESAFEPTSDKNYSGFPIKADDRMGAAQLKRLYREHCKNTVDSNSEEPAGFWLLTPDGFETAMKAKQLVQDMTSATEYVVNGMIKRLIHSMAVKTVGDRGVKFR